jgi:tRNA modification GTPase
MGYFNEDTIAAIASGAEVAAALGVIRISGKEAWPVAQKVLCRFRDNEPFGRDQIESHRLYRTLVKNAAGQPLDDGMFVWMKAPRSFTGEDVIELHLHGNPQLLRRVMLELLNAGAREALPGEFSFRAFQNGKLSLDQAESVSDLIASQSEESARRALAQLLGHGKRELDQLKKELVDRLAEVEVDIDFSDQGLSVLDYESLAGKLERWRQRVEVLRQEFLESQPLREGVRLALVGAPNSGKSSLFNRLLGEDRSIVSAKAGTTRDVVREALYLRGVLFRLSDTAGIRETGDELEAEGIDRSYGEVRSAQAVLWVFDGLVEEGELASRWNILKEHLSSGVKVLAVWNKADLAGEPSSQWTSFFQEKGIPAVVASAETGQGLEQLVDSLCSLFARTAPVGQDFFLSRQRHFAVLGAASEAVSGALEKIRNQERFPDLLAIDIRQALGQIGEITGEFSSEDLLNHIFAEFCIGK